jgi:hypothetical protein
MKFFAKIKDFFINLSDGIRFARLLIAECMSGDEE